MSWFPFLTDGNLGLPLMFLETTLQASHRKDQENVSGVCVLTGMLRRMGVCVLMGMIRSMCGGVCVCVCVCVCSQYIYAHIPCSHLLIKESLLPL